jgi:hypothetical protein
MIKKSKTMVGYVCALVLLMSVTLFGCAGLSTSPENSVCTDVPEGDSLICSKLKNPEQIDSLLLAVNYAAIRKGTYSPARAIVVLNDIEVIVKRGGITYLDLINEVTDILKQKDAAAVMLILSPNLNLFQEAIPIKSFDQKLLLAHIEHQRQLLMIMQ